ncbi:alpha/beta hydrolase [Rhodoferax sp.]|uniref:alpha/beta hydrolase n=1 Tax=Rhodoferax sp. TaxID=50421 RepID=UPI0025FA72D4|nr:alpha/beta hydrolase [Rhodoferax sp.]MCM2296027.1 alpha/beta hydrolase [Rhodoferax sp.]
MNHEIEWTSWAPDVLPGFEQATLSGLLASDGPVAVVLVRRRSLKPSGKAVLYVHGYVDYFFQTHLADFYNKAGLDFYAVDLRRHGRSMRAHQLPNYTSDIDEYLQDVDAAVNFLQGQEGVDWLLLNGHSTGGLVAALYAHRGQHRAAVQAVFLNSPFLDMNLPWWQELLLEPLVASLGSVLPHWQIPHHVVVYGESLHADHHGAWRYNTQWKPIEGFPVYAGWFRAMHRAHAEVAQGLSIDCPVLVMHAQRSTWPKRWSEETMSTDIVLDIADMQRLAPGLGRQVERLAIANGVHDLVLSAPQIREKVFNKLLNWLVRMGATQSIAPYHGSAVG